MFWLAVQIIRRLAVRLIILIVRIIARRIAVLAVLRISIVSINLVFLVDK